MTQGSVKLLTHWNWESSVGGGEGGADRNEPCEPQSASASSGPIEKGMKDLSGGDEGASPASSGRHATSPTGPPTLPLPSKRTSSSVSASGRDESASPSAALSSKVHNLQVNPGEYVYLDNECLAEFRTQICPDIQHYGKCQRHDLCPHSHCLAWQRRNPMQYYYTSELCPNICFVRNGEKMKLINSCNLGKNCTYAHSKEEQLYHPLNYKTKRCTSAGSCKRCFCPFAHEDSEIRTPRHIQYPPPQLQQQALEHENGKMQLQQQQSGGPAQPHHPQPPPPDQPPPPPAPPQMPPHQSNMQMGGRRNGGGPDGSPFNRGGGGGQGGPPGMFPFGPRAPDGSWPAHPPRHPNEMGGVGPMDGSHFGPGGGMRMPMDDGNGGGFMPGPNMPTGGVMGPRGPSAQMHGGGGGGWNGNGGGMMMEGHDQQGMFGGPVGGDGNVLSAPVGIGRGAWGRMNSDGSGMHMGGGGGDWGGFPGPGGGGDGGGGGGGFGWMGGPPDGAAPGGGEWGDENFDGSANQRVNMVGVGGMGPGPPPWMQRGGGFGQRGEGGESLWGGGQNEWQQQPQQSPTNHTGNGGGGEGGNPFGFHGPAGFTGPGGEFVPQQPPSQFIQQQPNSFNGDGPPQPSPPPNVSPPPPPPPDGQRRGGMNASGNAWGAQLSNIHVQGSVDGGGGRSGKSQSKVRGQQGNQQQQQGNGKNGRKSRNRDVPPGTWGESPNVNVASGPSPPLPPGMGPEGFGPRPPFDSSGPGGMDVSLPPPAGAGSPESFFNAGFAAGAGMPIPPPSFGMMGSPFESAADAPNPNRMSMDRGFPQPPPSVPFSAIDSPTGSDVLGFAVSVGAGPPPGMPSPPGIGPGGGSQNLLPPLQVDASGEFNPFMLNSQQGGGPPGVAATGAPGPGPGLNGSLSSSGCWAGGSPDVFSPAGGGDVPPGLFMANLAESAASFGDSPIGQGPPGFPFGPGGSNANAQGGPGGPPGFSGGMPGPPVLRQSRGSAFWGSGEQTEDESLSDPRQSSLSMSLSLPGGPDGPPFGGPNAPPSNFPPGPHIPCPPSPTAREVSVSGGSGEPSGASTPFEGGGMMNGPFPFPFPPSGFPPGAFGGMCGGGPPLGPPDSPEAFFGFMNQMAQMQQAASAAAASGGGKGPKGEQKRMAQQMMQFAQQMMQMAQEMVTSDGAEGGEQEPSAHNPFNQHRAPNQTQGPQANRSGAASPFGFGPGPGGKPPFPFPVPPEAPHKGANEQAEQKYAQQQQMASPEGALRSMWEGQAAAAAAAMMMGGMGGEKSDASFPPFPFPFGFPPFGFPPMQAGGMPPMPFPWGFPPNYMGGMGPGKEFEGLENDSCWSVERDGFRGMGMDSSGKSKKKKNRKQQEEEERGENGRGGPVGPSPFHLPKRGAPRYAYKGDEGELRERPTASTSAASAMKVDRGDASGEGGRDPDSPEGSGSASPRGRGRRGDGEEGSGASSRRTSESRSASRCPLSLSLPPKDDKEGGTQSSRTGGQISEGYGSRAISPQILRTPAGAGRGGEVGGGRDATREKGEKADDQSLFYYRPSGMTPGTAIGIHRGGALLISQEAEFHQQREENMRRQKERERRPKSKKKSHSATGEEEEEEEDGEVEEGKCPATPKNSGARGRVQAALKPLQQGGEKADRHGCIQKSGGEEGDDDEDQSSNSPAQSGSVSPTIDPSPSPCAREVFTQPPYLEKCYGSALLAEESDEEICSPKRHNTPATFARSTALRRPGTGGSAAWAPSPCGGDEGQGGPVGPSPIPAKSLAARQQKAEGEKKRSQEKGEDEDREGPPTALRTSSISAAEKEREENSNENVESLEGVGPSAIHNSVSLSGSSRSLIASLPAFPAMDGGESPSAAFAQSPTDGSLRLQQAGSQGKSQEREREKRDQRKRAEKEKSKGGEQSEESQSGHKQQQAENGSSPSSSSFDNRGGMDWFCGLPFAYPASSDKELQGAPTGPRSRTLWRHPTADCTAADAFANFPSHIGGGSLSRRHTATTTAAKPPRHGGRIGRAEGSGEEETSSSSADSSASPPPAVVRFQQQNGGVAHSRRAVAWTQSASGSSSATTAASSSSNRAIRKCVSGGSADPSGGSSPQARGSPGLFFTPQGGGSGSFGTGGQVSETSRKWESLLAQAFGCEGPGRHPFMGIGARRTEKEKGTGEESGGVAQEGERTEARTVPASDGSTD
uniref:C3H1-type domain-containing protein n=1 Tax=Chromera velia CCMP2878 TaxID=1169474 RepID=A0A0G4ICU3_9ALVE|eukprot:Cvel_13253.t1-p1 / transcript=Cvel_13253.t1 / gene=Cvel_13253 / organism=Chromera_velia_CCMP2878 / gene_product=RING finger protein unkempt, putative / transcript_product=RING finger protein unkempt, putative / location=Cvel_scaffold898:49700-57521(-) / protein_length=2182 / sequence_SO=supercontig / SO=protein_coding / is_pseudo=false